MRTKILTFLREHAGQYVSGEDISLKLGISRTAVWKHMQALKNNGYQIESHPRLGYFFHQAPDRLLPTEICTRLSTQILGSEIHYFTEVDSTNNVAKEKAAAGCKEGAIVVAEAQNGGKGRLARGWYSPLGKGVWLSVVLRPKFLPQEAPKSTMLAAVAVNKAIEKTIGFPCGIKWPNDILFKGKKLVGILTEMSAEMDAVNYIVIGMGINVNISQEDLPVEIREIATSLSIMAGHPVSRLDLVINLLSQLEDLYRIVQNQGFDPILEEWRRQTVTLGKMVDVYGIDRQFAGKALDIDKDGALLVETETGIEKVLAGDVSIRSRQ